MLSSQTQKAYYLKQIQQFVQAQNGVGRSFRTLVDSWFAHHMGCGFIKKTGSVQWFNRADLAEPRHLSAILQMHFISEKAWKVLSQQYSARIAPALVTHLVKDHAVPVKVMFDELKQLNLRSPLSSNAVEIFLLNRYRLGVITKTEDTALDKAGLRSKLPVGDYSVFARYNHVRILKHP